MIRILVLCLTLLSSHIANAEGDGQYQLASGDVVRITVFGEADLSFDEIRLNDAGTFSYPSSGR